MLVHVISLQVSRRVSAHDDVVAGATSVVVQAGLISGAAAA
jgi:hypothetical protein